MSLTRGGFNLVGYASSPLGLGEDLRQAAYAFLQAEVPFSIFDCPTESAVELPDKLKQYITERPCYGVTIFFMSPFAYASLMSTHGDLFSSTYRIGNFLWELEDFPSAWRHVLDAVQEIWVPTQFVKEIYYKAGCSNVHVIPAPAASLTQSPGSLRKTLDISADVFVFGFMFDLHSSIARKNPGGLIDAYIKMKLLLPPGRHTALLIKIHRKTFSSDALDELKSICAKHTDIIFIEETVSSDEVILFYNTLNAYISLHRSEGLGRTIIEAAQLGLPVICTDYSGSKDIIELGAAQGVPHSMVRCRPGEYPRCDGSIWANPGVFQAAVLMARLVKSANPSFACVDRLNSHFSPQTYIERVFARLNTIRDRNLAVALEI